MAWVNDEVFLQQDDADEAMVDGVQRAYEDKFNNELAEASDQHKRKHKEVLEILQEVRDD